MPTCYWKRCKEIATVKIDVPIEFEHPYICDKHMNRLLNKLGILKEVFDGREQKL